jgi:hypothetical protein
MLKINFKKILLIHLQIKKYFKIQSLSLYQTPPSIFQSRSLTSFIFHCLWSSQCFTQVIMHRLSAIPDSHEHDEKAPVMALLTWIQNLLFHALSSHKILGFNPPTLSHIDKARPIASHQHVIQTREFYFSLDLHIVHIIPIHYTHHTRISNRYEWWNW